MSRHLSSNGNAPTSPRFGAGSPCLRRDPIVWLLPFLLLISICAAVGSAHASAEGPDPGFTGIPAGGGLSAEGDCSFCHMGSRPNQDGKGSVSLEGLPATFEAGAKYPLTFRFSHSDPDVIRWGFQLTAVFQNSRLGAGELRVTDELNTQVIGGGAGGRSYVMHTNVGTAIGMESENSWVFEWIAPATSDGPVEFFAAANAANLDGDKTGDRIYTTSPKPLATTKPGASADSEKPKE
jgi:hypothetical protein